MRWFGYIEDPKTGHARRLSMELDTDNAGIAGITLVQAAYFGKEDALEDFQMFRETGDSDYLHDVNPGCVVGIGKNAEEARENARNRGENKMPESAEELQIRPMVKETLRRHRVEEAKKQKAKRRSTRPTKPDIARAEKFRNALFMIKKAEGMIAPLKKLVRTAQTEIKEFNREWILALPEYESNIAIIKDMYFKLVPERRYKSAQPSYRDLADKLVIELEALGKDMSDKLEQLIDDSKKILTAPAEVEYGTVESSVKYPMVEAWPRLSRLWNSFVGWLKGITRRVTNLKSKVDDLIGA